jgi:CPA1 family monovalent cation:H+ antiporter
MSYTDVWPWRASTRLHRTAVWDTLQMMANGSIFVLLGEQIPALVAAAPRTVLATGHSDPVWLLIYMAVVVGALGALRFAWVWASLKITIIGARRSGRAPPWSGWRVVMVTSLAGVRGAVTLAGVMTLPAALASGEPFPGRELAILLAAGVIVLSLVVASIALPYTLRGLELPAEPSHWVAEQRARAAAAEMALAAIDAAQHEAVEGVAERRRSSAVAMRIADLYRLRIDHHGQAGGDTPARRGKDDDIERRLRLVGLRAEREELLRFGREHGLADLTLRKMVRELDLQEARWGG